MSESYASFKYDLGLISSEEAEHFQVADVHWPENFLVSDTLQYHEFKTGSGTVGVLLFPELNKAKEPGPRMTRAIERMCKEKREETDLLIGLSPWGYWAEQNYLKSEPKYGVDILLGSGPGVEVTGKLMNNDSVLWNRAYGRGKHVLRIDIESWPKADSPKWKKDINIHAESIALTDSYVEDSHIFSIIGKALK